MKNYLCIDIGGSSIKHGVLNDSFEILVQNSTPTPQNLEAFYKELTNLLVLYNDYNIEGVAISSPGCVDSCKGVINGSSALPYIHGFNIKKALQERFNLPLTIQNDANCGALAETNLGVGKNYQNAIIIICGTGIGGTIIKNKQIHYGKNLFGGEFGCIIINEFSPHTPNKYGTISDYASVGSLVRRIEVKSGINNLNGKKVFDLALNNQIAKQEIEVFYHNLALLCFNLQFIYDPEVFILGGAISIREDFIDNIYNHIEKIILKCPTEYIMPNITKCHFLHNANLIGALYFYLHNDLK